MLATTPFSISDILTKNNTSIYKKSMSSPMSQSSGHLSDTETVSHPSLETRLPQHSGYHQMECESIEDRRQSFIANHDGKEQHHYDDRNLAKRRGSLDCFLIDSNHNNTDRDKISSMTGYYNYPMVMETPLDMRRCVNDSGE